MRRKRILITGAGSGFGELTAIGLAKEGHVSSTNSGTNSSGNSGTTGRGRRR